MFVIVGRDRPELLRWGLVSIGAVWASSLALPALLSAGWLAAERKEPARRLILWGQKWLLQGLAFFLLPLYHRSAVYTPGQTAFMALLAAAALAATIDVVYDDVVTPRRPLHGSLLAFIAFATVNVTLPMVWRTGGLWSLGAGGLLATAVFVSFVASSGPDRTLGRAALVGVLFLALVTLGRPAVPPAPLRLVSAHVGRTVAPNGLDVASPLSSLSAGPGGPLVAVAAVFAPAGLDEGVRHVWSLDGRPLFRSRVIGITGGRQEGFRSRSGVTVGPLARGQRLRLDVETAHGQLVGRTELEVTDASPRSRASSPSEPL
ncbi:MAG: DUF5924 family protein [Thermoanaerobaculia bacterium]